MFPLDQAGDAVDSSLNAGLDVLRGGSPNSPVTTVKYTATDLPKVDPRAADRATHRAQVTSTIIVPDNFLVQGDTTSSGISGLRVTLNLTYPNDPDLTLTLEPLRPERRPAGLGRPGQQRRRQPRNTANFTQHDLRRQRDDADPERRRTVLRHVQPPDAAVELRRA